MLACTEDGQTRPHVSSGPKVLLGRLGQGHEPWIRVASGDLVGPGGTWWLLILSRWHWDDGEAPLEIASMSPLAGKSVRCAWCLVLGFQEKSRYDWTRRTPFFCTWTQLGTRWDAGKVGDEPGKHEYCQLLDQTKASPQGPSTWGQFLDWWAVCHISVLVRLIWPAKCMGCILLYTGHVSELLLPLVTSTSNRRKSSLMVTSLASTPRALSSRATSRGSAGSMDSMHQAQVANVNVAKAAAFGDSPEMDKKANMAKIQRFLPEKPADEKLEMQEDFRFSDLIGELDVWSWRGCGSWTLQTATNMDSAWCQVVFFAKTEWNIKPMCKLRGCDPESSELSLTHENLWVWHCWHSPDSSAANFLRLAPMPDVEALLGIGPAVSSGHGLLWSYPQLTFPMRMVVTYQPAEARMLSAICHWLDARDEPFWWGTKSFGGRRISILRFMF